MHALHKILVYIPNVTLGDDLDKEDLIEAIRDQAVSDTECYEGIVFDWRSTDDLGVWNEDYPCNVLLAKDNLEKVLEELVNCYEHQKLSFENTLRKIKGIVGYDISDVSQKIFGERSNDIHNYDLSYNIGVLGNLASGHYTIDSEFYDTNASTAKITKNTINMVKSDPNNWALVMCDYHY